MYILTEISLILEYIIVTYIVRNNKSIQIFGEKLRQLMKSCGINQVNLAKILDAYKDLQDDSGIKKAIDNLLPITASENNQKGENDE